MSIPGIICLVVSLIAMSLFCGGLYLIDKWKDEEDKNDKM